MFLPSFSVTSFNFCFCVKIEQCAKPVLVCAKLFHILLDIRLFRIILSGGDIFLVLLKIPADENSFEFY